MNIQEAIHKVVDGKDLTEEEMISVMGQVMEGTVPQSQMGAFLTALRMKGESVGEIVGAARVMRQKAETLNVSSDNIVDTCGTGGDGGNTFNISTASAFVVAGAGITVAKHGNRAVSSRSGSADVLKCLGVNIEADKTVVEKCLEQVGIGFLVRPDDAWGHEARRRGPQGTGIQNDLQPAGTVDQSRSGACAGGGGI